MLLKRKTPTTWLMGVFSNGYDIEINPDEAFAVKRMFDLTDRYGYGGRKISTILKSEGIVNLRTGEPFHYSTIQHILANIMNAGILRSGETQSEVFPELQIIPLEQFQRVAKAREQRSVNYAIKCGWEPETITLADGSEATVVRSTGTYPRKIVGKALLSGNVYCGHCGGRIFATKGLVTNQLVLTVGYDRENLDDPYRRQNYHGPVTIDRYGRKIPKHAVGTENFPYTSSANDLLKAVTDLYDRIVSKNLLVRRLSISANKLLPEADVPSKNETEQLDLFTDYAAKEQQEQADETAHARERKLQEAMLGIKKRYGKNAILKGMNLEDGATARERNQTIGGHHE